ESSLSDVHRHPPHQRARRQPSTGSRSSRKKQLSIQQSTRFCRHPCGWCERTKEYSLLDAEDMQSSTRVDSMALLGTKARDEYYRNDSPVDQCVSEAVICGGRRAVRGAHTEVLST
ncbi:hypothetical protein CCMA1212_009876, partial [Trichoderma ghanense]